MSSVATNLPIGSVTAAQIPTSPKRRSVGAVVMDADYRGLAVARSLGRHGIPVWVLQHGDQLLAAFSHYSRRRLRWPSRNEEEMTNFLVSLSERDCIRDWVLFPTGDPAVAQVARHHKTLSRHFQLTTPSWGVLQWLHDKRLAYRLADLVGVDHPATIYPASREEVASSTFQFPVILKPTLYTGFNRLTASKAWRADNMGQLLTRYEEASTLVDPETLMIQELIPGRGESQLSYTALCRDGQPLVSLTARRTRQFPMDFGRASTFVETVEDSASSDAAVRLLAPLRYTGIVEVEFKRDPRNGKLNLLDINPRVWGWHSLCGFAGVDYPYLLWLLTTGEPVPHVKAAAGARWVRMSTDALTAIREILNGRLTLREYLHSIRPPLAPSIYASDDPWPGLLEIPLLIYLAGKRVFAGNGAV